MNPEWVFLQDGNLRSLWRFFLAVVLVLAVYVLAAEAGIRATTALGLPPGPWTALVWVDVPRLAGLLAGFKVLSRVFDRRPLRSMGLALHARWGRELGQGLAVGGVMVMIAVVPEWGCGYARFTVSSPPRPGYALYITTFLILAAAQEEIIFRGYPFQRLVESLGPLGAVGISSILFGLLHLGNPHPTWFSTANTALVGITFALAYLRTRALWMPIAMHFAWNFLSGCVLGLPVSGIDFQTSILRATVSGQGWLTGAAYGPEGGALGTVAIVAATLFLLLAKGISMTEEMRTLVFAAAAPREPEPPLSIFTAGSRDE